MSEIRTTLLVTKSEKLLTKDLESLINAITNFRHLIGSDVEIMILLSPLTQAELEQEYYQQHHFFLQSLLNRLGANFYPKYDATDIELIAVIKNQTISNESGYYYIGDYG